ncbi:MAG: hypothetical protein ACJ763_07125 [Bdellovibrionia bacterium]
MKTKIVLMIFVLITMAGLAAKKYGTSSPSETVAASKMRLMGQSQEEQKDETAQAHPSSDKNERQLTQSLVKLQALSKIVISTPEKTAALRDLLSDQRLQAEISRVMVDPGTYQGEGFHRKLRLIDALYEGLKIQDSSLQERYFTIASDVMTVSPPEVIQKDPELLRQFVADRAEIALSLLKAFPERAQAMERKTTSESKEAALAFQNAHRLLSTYNVSI